MRLSPSLSPGPGRKAGASLYTRKHLSHSLSFILSSKGDDCQALVYGDWMAGTGLLLSLMSPELPLHVAVPCGSRAASSVHRMVGFRKVCPPCHTRWRLHRMWLTLKCSASSPVICMNIFLWGISGPLTRRRWRPGTARTAAPPTSAPQAGPNSSPRMCGWLNGRGGRCTGAPVHWYTMSTCALVHWCTMSGSVQVPWYTMSKYSVLAGGVWPLCHWYTGAL